MGEWLSVRMRATLKNLEVVEKTLDIIYGVLGDYGCSPGFRAPMWLLASCRGDSLVKASVKLKMPLGGGSLEPGEVVVEVSSRDSSRIVELAEAVFLALRSEGLPLELD
ncbi:hypothetical protein APE_2118.1 [Aeropyrum pernix K1]|uniref:Uncharacterized protein n=1 Tax=Aeropyrum pernix (strain ATCC 700893 / DSM 11879 / JCM 9820 / NBRC 100138 / K1) TaxID=272557 RepID=Q9YA21_AERPE|nr:hypothetical protein [Aeropyrum pernix]BAA81129.2 hypothetical protein APE_2118.1 [Aeropyrum pernix K1]